MRPLSHYYSALMRRLRSRFICFGSLRSPNPVNPYFGIDQGTPIDRIYIDKFFAKHKELLKGKVLEIGEPRYSLAFGNPADMDIKILSFYEGEGVDYCGRLESMPEIADESFDCIVLVETLHYVFNMFDALSEIHRVLKPGGVVLCCVPSLIQISRYDMEMWGDRWRLTSLSARELFETQFKPDQVEVETFGNALSATAFIQGIPAERLRKKELDAWHEDYQVLVCIVARKS